ncbi:hypothetical protein CEXT_555741 [Caerostris extrusa]|uniref:Gustatory receptor n=1 Tax=Caerostris extrusa TaxID=172846 RepID=A0AAV4MRE4_CAEEX|nr:hypothetical protein CEXT_555741 [Caerostris extrusa]
MGILRCKRFRVLVCCSVDCRGVPIELNEFKAVFYKKAFVRMMSSTTLEEPKLERWLFDKPHFVFTGCDIVSYRRSTVLAVVGTLLTYTVLVIN